jgi:YesN/AraC family two-component response regulator
MPYRIVIIDDEKEISNGFARFFPWKGLGFTVIGQFSGAKSALQFIKNNPVDLVVSDVIMPGMSGIDLARELAENPLDPRPLVVLFSAHNEFEYAREALRYRCTDYILKSAEYDELIEIFRRLKERMDRESHVTGESKDRIIETVKNYIRTHTVDANLDDAAARVYMSPGYLSRYFKEKTSRSFSDCLMRVRMERAGSLLTDLKNKIYDVSSELGYTNPENFARSFKKFYGVSPREYRQERLGRRRDQDGDGNR